MNFNVSSDMVTWQVSAQSHEWPHHWCQHARPPTLAPRCLLDIQLCQLHRPYDALYEFDAAANISSREHFQKRKVLLVMQPVTSNNTCSSSLSLFKGLANISDCSFKCAICSCIIWRCHLGSLEALPTVIKYWRLGLGPALKTCIVRRS